MCAMQTRMLYPMCHLSKTRSTTMCLRFAHALMRAQKPQECWSKTLSLARMRRQRYGWSCGPQQGWVKVEGLQWEIVVPQGAAETGGRREHGKVARGGSADGQDSAAELSPLLAACFWVPPRHRCKCAPDAHVRACGASLTMVASHAQCLDACCALSGRIVACRYATEAQSSRAGESMHGMPISRAMLAADAAQPPALSFTQRSCLTFTVQQPSPLLFVRPPGSTDALAAPPVPQTTVDELFADWSAAQRSVCVPETLLMGELAPLPLVVSRRAGQSATALRLASASGDVAVLANISCSAMLQPPPEQLVSMHDRFSSSADAAGSADAAPVAVSNIDAKPQRWIASGDGYEHLSITVWLRTRASAR